MDTVPFMRTLFGEDIVERMGAFLKENPSVDWTTRQLFSGLEGYPKDVESTGFRIADELNNDGWDLHRTGHYREAIDAYEKTLSHCPEFPTVWNNKGPAHATLGEFHEAKAAFERAIELNPFFIRPFSNMGILFYELKRDLSTAEQWLNRDQDIERAG